MDTTEKNSTEFPTGKIWPVYGPETLDTRLRIPTIPASQRKVPARFLYGRHAREAGYSPENPVKCPDCQTGRFRKTAENARIPSGAYKPPVRPKKPGTRFSKAG